MSELSLKEERKGTQAKGSLMGSPGLRESSEAISHRSLLHGHMPLPPPQRVLLHMSIYKAAAGHKLLQARACVSLYPCCQHTPQPLKAQVDSGKGLDQVTPRPGCAGHGGRAHLHTLFLVLHAVQLIVLIAVFVLAVLQEGDLPQH